MMNETLSKSLNEKDVENTYRHNFLKKFKDMEITSPFGCDGFGVSKSSKVRTLMEFKDNMNLTNKVELVKVLAQSVFYIKKFYDKGIIPPSTIFIGDRDECLTIHVNDILKYLEMDLNWSTAPSQAHTIADLVLALMKDESIQPFVYDSKDFLDCIEKVKDLTDNVQRKVLVTDKNITEVFRHFDEKVLGKNKLTTNERANLFVQILVNKDDNYLHPVKKRKTVVTKSFGEVSLVSRDAFESFFGHFSSSYTPSQKHKLAAVVDRIVEDTTRRKQGEFFTPAIWVDKAHEYIASVYGEDWKDKYIVWDPAWGTGNLTRDYNFKELYVSTLNQSDIDTANQMGYNTEAVKFQYDFLNDDYEKLPVGLRNAIEGGKKIIVLMNPPYVTGASSMVKSKKGASDTVVRTKMKNFPISFGKSSANLYSQFIFNSLSNGNVNLALFSPPLYLSGSAFKGMRIFLKDKVHFAKGFMMDAANFADVKSWGLSFTILKNGVIESNQTDNFNLDLLDIDEDFTIINKGEKLIYNTDNLIAGNVFVKSKNKTRTKIDFPHVSSPLNIVNHGTIKITSDFLGYLNSNGNNVRYNNTLVGIYSAIFSGGGNGKGHSPGFSINYENFIDVMSYFTSRKLIKGNWINWYDEYLNPNEKHESFGQFKYDSIVYSLFESKSNQSSLRQITYKDRLWDIKNEFFWMSVDKMKELSDEKGYDELYNDARTSPDRYVHKLLFGEERIYDKLSPDAKAVLDKATELVEKSMELRQVMANDENHLNSWDAGYAQLKLVWKEYFQEDFKEFRQLYKELENRMRPMVYELGFLLK
jgi:hypothetical protein